MKIVSSIPKNATQRILKQYYAQEAKQALVANKSQEYNYLTGDFTVSMAKLILKGMKVGNDIKRALHIY